MQAQGGTGRILFTIGVAGLLAGCVQPAYVTPGPIQLQPYPPPVSYQFNPEVRPPAGPIPLQPPPLVQPLPPPTPAPTVTDDAGAIPVQDMPPPPTVDMTTPAADAAPPPAAPEIVRKTPTSGPGSNVPLEGFRPMKGQTRPAP